MARAITSEANAEPPGLFTRSTTPAIDGSFLHCSSAATRLSAPATEPSENGSCWLSESTIVPSTSSTASRRFFQARGCTGDESSPRTAMPGCPEAWPR